MAQDLWTPALLGLVNTRLDIFYSGMEQNHLAVDETQARGTWDSPLYLLQFMLQLQ